MTARRKDPYFESMYAWTVFTGSFAWLVTVRSLAEPDYEWGMYGLRGPGTGGYFWVVALSVTFVTLTLYSERRGRLRASAYGFAIWHTVVLVALTRALWQPGTGTIRGDSWGLEVAAWPMLLPVTAGFAASLFLLRRVLKDRPARRSRVRWGARQELCLVSTAILVFPIFVGFRAGPIHGWGDRTAVLLTIAQWLLLVLGAFPKPDVEDDTARGRGEEGHEPGDEPRS